MWLFGGIGGGGSGFDVGVGEVRDGMLQAEGGVGSSYIKKFAERM